MNAVLIGEGHKAAKARVKAERIAGVAKVLGVSKLRSKFESHEAKRNLCAQYDLFLADERVLPSLPKLIGASAWSPLEIQLYMLGYVAVLRGWVHRHQPMHARMDLLLVIIQPIHGTLQLGNTKSWSLVD